MHPTLLNERLCRSRYPTGIATDDRVPSERVIRRPLRIELQTDEHNAKVTVTRKYKKLFFNKFNINQEMSSTNPLTLIS